MITTLFSTTRRLNVNELRPCCSKGIHSAMGPTDPLYLPLVCHCEKRRGSSEAIRRLVELGLRALAREVI